MSIRTSADPKVHPGQTGSADGKWLGRVVIAGMIVLVLLPIVPLLLYSVAGPWFYPELVPDEWSLRAWRYVAEPRSMVAKATWTSLVVALTVTLLSVVIGVPAGRGLAALPVGARTFMEFLFFAPIVIPSLAVALGLHVAFVRWGMADSLPGVIVSHLLPTLPYMVLVMASTFAHSHNDLEFQARTLGAGPVRAFLEIGVRAALPGILTGGLFVFLISWSQYALTLLVGGGRVLTLPLLLFSFASSGDLAITAALSVVFLIPAVIALAVSARFLTGRSVVLAGVAR